MSSRVKLRAIDCDHEEAVSSSTADSKGAEHDEMTATQADSGDSGAKMREVKGKSEDQDDVARRARIAELEAKLVRALAEAIKDLHSIRAGDRLEKVAL